MKTIVRTLDVPAAEGLSAAYLAHPDEGAHPAVLLIPDVFGLRPAIRAMCERIASWGYTVLAPNLVYREHGLPLVPMMNLRDPDKMASAMRTTFEWTAAVPLDDTVDDARVWFDWLAGQRFVTGDRVGVTGYCRGGFLALLLAERLSERVACAGIFHAARLVSDAPDSLHLGVGSVRGELLLRPADQDPGMDAGAQATLGRALDAAGVRYSQEVYPDAPHGYAMADTWRFQQAASERHYTELHELLDRCLPTSPRG